MKTAHFVGVITMCDDFHDFEFRADAARRIQQVLPERRDIVGATNGCATGRQESARRPHNARQLLRHRRR